MRHDARTTSHGKAPGRLVDYLALTRPGHWIKHLFIVPGIVLAALLHDRSLDGAGPALVWGFLSACLVASANYVLNEWLDRDFDRFHPHKSARPAVQRELSPPLMLLEYVVLLVGALLAASRISALFLLTVTVFAVAAWIYNVPPLRTKDVAYLDVLSESVNNTLRLTMGWAMVDGHTLPPGSLLLAFWTAGAFLMSVKRLAELRAVVAAVGPDSLERYRRSFRTYTEASLTVSAMVYAFLTAFFIAVFFVKYRIEYLLALPVLAWLFGEYLALGLRRDSAVQEPEKLWREPRLLLLTGLLAVVLLLTTWIDLPLLDRLTDPHYIELPFPSAARR